MNHTYTPTGIYTPSKRKDIGSAVIQYLSGKTDKQDDLDGITLFIYEKELKNLSIEIMNVISELLVRGFLTEHVNSYGKKYYQLLPNDLLDIPDLSEEQ